MKEQIETVMQTVTSLDQVRDNVIEVFRTLREENGVTRIGYASGILYSDGPEHVDRNKKRLRQHTEKLRAEMDFPIFSAVDIFTDEVYNRINIVDIPFEERRNIFLKFWREVLSCGHITDVIMTPRWEKSEGATDEYNTAQQNGLTILIVESKA